MDATPPAIVDGRAPAANAVAQGIDPVRLFWLAVHHRWLFAAFMVCGILAGVIWTALQSPVYTASAKIEIESSSIKALRDIDVTANVSDLQKFETARQRLLSRELAARVVDALDLVSDESFLNSSAAGAASRKAEAVTRIVQGLSATLLRNTGIIRVTFSHSVPEHAAMVANQTVRSFMAFNVERGNTISQRARGFIGEQAQRAKEELEQAEQALVDYATEQDLTVMTDNPSLLSANLVNLNKLLAQAVDERLEAERYVEQRKRDGSALLPQVFASRSIQLAQARLGEMQAEYQQKLATLKPGFPEMRKLRTKIASTKRNIDREIASIGNSVVLQLRQAGKKEEALRAELKRLEIQQREYDRRSIRYTILKREADSKRGLYETLIKKQSNVGVGAQLKTVGAEFIEPARTPEVATSPNLLLNLLISLAVFAGLGGLCILLIEMFNDRIAVPEQIHHELGLKTLGTIPYVSGADLKIAGSKRKTAFQEAYRSLRSSLHFVDAGRNMQTLVVTSPEKGDGKSTTAIKIAMDYAALGKSVLLIDADMRNPALHRKFGVGNETGFSNLVGTVLSKDEIRDCFKETDDDNLTLLTAGAVPPNAADLLASEKMESVLRHFCAHYDMVVMDAPPVAGIADAPLLSRLADGTVLVIACKTTRIGAARMAVERLHAAGGDILGAVLTKFRIGRFDRHRVFHGMDVNDGATLETSSRTGNWNALAGRIESGMTQNANFVHTMIDRVSQTFAAQTMPQSKARTPDGGRTDHEKEPLRHAQNIQR